MGEKFVDVKLGKEFGEGLIGFAVLAFAKGTDDVIVDDVTTDFHEFLDEVLVFLMRNFKAKKFEFIVITKIGDSGISFAI